jgi:hypothetical protein
LTTFEPVARAISQQSTMWAIAFARTAADGWHSEPSL